MLITGTEEIFDMSDIKTYLYLTNQISSDMAIVINAIMAIKDSIIQAQKYRAETIRKYLFNQMAVVTKFYGLEFSGYARMSLLVYKVKLFYYRLIM